MKTKRKIVFFIALMSLFYCISLMQDTYAKYLSSATENAELTIARWSILINNQDVVNESNFTDTISPVFAGSTNIKSDVLAPTAQGYFELILNGENTDVSFQYSIGIDTTDCAVEDLVITSYEIDGVTYPFSGTNVVGNINLNDPSRTKTIKFNVAWNDDAATQTMNNAADTAAAAEETAAFSVDVNLIQLQ
jgi:hypothetical protein